MAEPRPLHPRGEEPIGALVQELIADMRDLVQDEFRLARGEMSEAISNSVNASLVAAIGGSLAFLGVAYLLLAAVFALASVIVPWLAALMVGAAVLVVGGILLLIGRNRLKHMSFVPEDTVESIREGGV
ncbi:MAG: phage holin family protein [Chloroflexi bacterium]|nr:phage holin family protein [Chloroflexota bacterium]